MQIQIMGAGSLGMLFAAKLANSGERISLLTRREAQSLQIKHNGLILIPQGEERSGAVRVNSVAYDSEEPGASHADWIFLMVKQQHITTDLIQSISRQLGEHGKLLCFQNGIGHVEKMTTLIAPERIYVAVTTEGAKKNNDFTVTHTGSGTTWLGRMDKPYAQSAVHEDDKKLVQLLNKAGFKTVLSKQMDRFVWIKLLINSIINPLTAIFKIRNGALLESPELVQMMRSLFEEGRAVAHARGLNLGIDVWEQVVEVCHKTAENHSSMLQDVLAGKTTEVDWINGGLLQIAEQHGIQMPTHQTVYRMVKALNG